MPNKPSFSTKPPPRIKRSKGAISRDTSKRKDVVDDVHTDSKRSSNNEVIQQIEAPKTNSVAQMVRQFELNKGSNIAADISADNGCDVLKKALLDDINIHGKLLKELSAFTLKEIITRREIVSLTDTVSCYTELNDVEVKIVRDYKRYVVTLKLTEDQVEASANHIKPSSIDSCLDSSATVIENAMAKFRRMKLEYPDSPQVTTCLDFVDTCVQSKKGSDVSSSKSSKKGSECSMGDIESIRSKIIRTKADLEKKLKDVESKILDEGVVKDVSFHQSVCRRLGKLDSKANSTLEKLSEKLEQNCDATESEILEFDEWINQFQQN